MTPSPPYDRAGQAPFGARRFFQQSFAVFKQRALLDYIREQANSDRFSYIVTPNTDHIVRLDKLAAGPLGPRLREAYDRAALRVCDSRVIALFARISGVRLDVMAGSDLTRLLFQQGMVGPGDRVALVGGTPTQLEWLRGFRREVEFVGHFPPMGVLENAAAQQEIVEFVEEVRCNFYFFCFGSPQSELVAAAIARRGKTRGVAMCVGASIDYLSGVKRRAPLWIQRMSLEWVYRLALEPRRLWRRYLVDGPRILSIWRREHAALGHKELRS